VEFYCTGALYTLRKKIHQDAKAVQGKMVKLSWPI